MSGAWRAAVALTALGCAGSGGAFLVFSTLTATALRRLPAAQAMAAMQQVNEAAPRSAVFMAVVFGPAVAGLVLAVRALAHRGEPHGALVVVGAVVYVVGVAGMTVVFHVPRNQALAALDPVVYASSWGSWFSSWVAGNHVRVVSAFVAAGLLMAGLRR